MMKRYFTDSKRDLKDSKLVWSVSFIFIIVIVYKELIILFFIYDVLSRNSSFFYLVIFSFISIKIRLYMSCCIFSCCLWNDRFTNKLLRIN